ncbi:hypothetical protein B0J11DRAFT_542285 [Dendryphion nanum]|uniref:Uncharacterized protein n=1 Tax=Dendryphion nanum TaxID=256645 RepID=A0A9P9D5E2_9PLEO|nr:hypothetical protein B0J11DRAFT_542285 [Dendryphion nanum]
MAKKHAPSYTHTKPSYVHPSLQSARSPPASPTSPQSVNERLQQLRREQTPRASTERRDEITEVVTQRTVPPNLRRILHMAEVDAPRPKPGSRSRIAALRRGGHRPPPGPAAPNSWLNASRDAQVHIRGGAGLDKEEQPVGFGLLAKAHNDDFKRLPRPGSLIHYCLKTFAENWEELAIYEQHNLPLLQAQLKEPLLSYLWLYGKENCLSTKTFKILFGGDSDGSSSSGSADIKFLDLTGLISREYTLEALHRSLRKSFPKTSASEGISSLSLRSPKNKESTTPTLADSWDQDDIACSSSTNIMTLGTPIFPNLTRLSLAHPGSAASWSELVDFSKHLNTLTHLSLAYWPRPSMTNPTKARSMAARYVTLDALHGADVSDDEDDWSEATNIIRRLSHETYCLQWLDLEGCTWHKALTYNPHTPSRFQRPTPRDTSVRWNEATNSQTGPDWTGSWRQITYLNLSQGWIPKDFERLRAAPASKVAVQFLVWLSDHKNNPRYVNQFRTGPGYDGIDWLRRERESRTVADEIKMQRNSGEVGEFCKVDFGWDPREKAPKVDSDEDGA